MKTIRNIIYPSFAAIALAYFALTPRAQAVTPAPDGAYPGFNTAEGQNALFSLDISTGLANTAVGWFSLKSNQDTSFNTGVGAGTLLLNTADENTAVGAAALLLNTTGSLNTAVGATALLNNTEGDDNTATGVNALFANTTGSFNTATGWHALSSNTTGESNTADGINALQGNTTGNANVAIGNAALSSNTAGGGNVAIGQGALFTNTTGANNVAMGSAALASNIGDNNIAIGTSALASNTGDGNSTVIGFNALANSLDGDNIALGVNAGVDHSTGINNIYIGSPGAADEANTIRIGGDTTGVGPQTATFVAGISGTTVVGDTVVVDPNGQLGTIASSQRFKTEIKPMDQVSEAILSLKPVTFRYKKELDARGIPQFGLVAEEVAKVNPDLVVRDRKGEIYSVRYEAVNAMLLNEFLKAHHKMQEQEATIAQLKSNDAEQQREVKALTATVKDQASQIQKVSAQLQLTKRASQTVANNH